jgi:hypothetical protein
LYVEHFVTILNLLLYILFQFWMYCMLFECVVHMLSEWVACCFNVLMLFECVVVHFASILNVLYICMLFECVVVHFLQFWICCMLFECVVVHFSSILNVLYVVWMCFCTFCFTFDWVVCTWVCCLSVCCTFYFNFGREKEKILSAPTTVSLLQPGKQ